MNNAKLTKGCFAGEMPETFDSPTRAVTKIEMINIVVIKDTKSRVSRLNLCDRLSMLYARTISLAISRVKRFFTECDTSSLELSAPGLRKNLIHPSPLTFRPTPNRSSKSIEFVFFLMYFANIVHADKIVTIRPIAFAISSSISMTTPLLSSLVNIDSLLIEFTTEH